MRTAFFVWVIGIAGVLGASAIAAASADAPSYMPDQDRALSAVQAGDAIPLGTIIEQRHLKERLVDVRLIEEGSMLIYDLTVIGTNGQTQHLRIDARTGSSL